MGRPRQWPPLPHPHRPSGQERVRYGGHDYYLGPIGSQDAREAYAKLLLELAKGATPKPSRSKSLTVAEIIERWDVYAASRYDPAGKEARQFTYSLEPLLAVHGGTAASEFGVSHLDDVREEMIRRGLSRKVVNRRIVRVRTFFRWAERRGLVPAGTWSALRSLPPLERGDRRVVTHPPRQPAEWKTLASVCRQCPRTVRDMLLVQWYTGCRSAEVRRMVVREIDRQGEVWTYRPAAHKGTWRGRSREVAIGPRAQRVLLSYLQGKSADDYVFPSGPGRCYSEESYPRAVARACERAGVSGFSPYSLRHAAKQRVTRAIGLDAARAVLGQSSLDTTDRYAAGGDSKVAQDAAKLLG